MNPKEPYSYRADKNIPAFADDKPLIIFDGECVFCSDFAHFILRRDKHNVFRLLTAQAPLGTALYAHYGLRSKEYETSILIENGFMWSKSEGTIRMLEHLRFPWSLATLFRIFSLKLRDKLYDVVANNRLKWFGKRICYTPSPVDADRFLK